MDSMMDDRLAPTAEFLGLADTDPSEADVLLLPLPYEGTVCYGKGTSLGPAAIWEASTHPEHWDEELDFDLSSLRFHNATPLTPESEEDPGAYLDRVGSAAAALHDHGGLVVGVGGEHSLTPPLVAAAVEGGDDLLSVVTVVQFDAHADLRASYQGSAHSHACAMHHVVAAGADLIAVGIRSADKEEAAWGVSTGKVRTFYGHSLETDSAPEAELLSTLTSLTGDVYLTFDIDGLEPALCPGTGTPVPGGLSWWQTMRYLEALLYRNRGINLVGCDLVETVPQPHTQVNEYTAARLLLKIIAYRLSAE
jgi:agmatinase